SPGVLKVPGSVLELLIEAVTAPGLGAGRPRAWAVGGRAVLGSAWWRASALSAPGRVKLRTDASESSGPRWHVVQRPLPSRGARASSFVPMPPGPSRTRPAQDISVELPGGPTACEARPPLPIRSAPVPFAVAPKGSLPLNVGDARPSQNRLRVNTAPIIEGA